MNRTVGVTQVIVMIAVGAAVVFLYSEFLKHMEERNEKHMKFLQDLALDAYPNKKEKVE